jgi:hypothetical protein
MNIYKKIIAVTMIIFSLSGCAQKGKITSSQDRFTGLSTTELDLGTLSPRPLFTVKKNEERFQSKNSNFSVGDVEKKEYRKVEKGEFSGKATLVKHSDQSYFLEIIQPNCGGGKSGNLVVFLADGKKINSILFSSIKRKTVMYTQHGAIHICQEAATIGPLPQSFFDAAKTSEFVEFKIYNEWSNSISSINKKELELITNFVKQ